MRTDIEKLKLAAEKVKGWGLGQAWLDTSEDESVAVVGQIDEDGRAYPVVVVDCDQYFQGQDSLPVAKFYALANPDAVLELVEELETVARERDELAFSWAGCSQQLKDACKDLDDTEQRLVEVAWSRDKLIAAVRAVEYDSEECLDFDECTAMCVPIDTYHALIEAADAVINPEKDS